MALRQILALFEGAASSGPPVGFQRQTSDMETAAMLCSAAARAQMTDSEGMGIVSPRQRPDERIKFSCLA